MPDARPLMLRMYYSSFSKDHEQGLNGQDSSLFNQFSLIYNWATEAYAKLQAAEKTSELTQQVEALRAQLQRTQSSQPRV